MCRSSHRSQPSFRLKTVALNPNSYASTGGITWALIANRWHFEMLSITEGLVLIMSTAGTGMAMLSMGLFMALQDNILACGPSLMAFRMTLKFIAIAIGATAIILRSDILYHSN